jgi:Rod binding domain-containing protein
LSINPGSDIVLDVIRAADPTRAQEAARRLEALGGVTAASPEGFEKELASLDPTGESSSAALSAANARSRLTKASDASDQRAQDVKTKFEASILSTFVKELLPKDSAIYGEGTAGDVWKSMLAQQIATQVAKSGVLGISKKLFETHDLPHAHAAASAGESARATDPKAVQGSSNPLSMSSSANLVDGAFLFKAREVL